MLAQFEERRSSSNIFLPRIRFKTNTKCNNKACILEHVYIEKGASVNKRRRNIPVAAYAFDTNFINHYSCSSVFSLKGYYSDTYRSPLVVGLFTFQEESLSLGEANNYYGSTYLLKYGCIFLIFHLFFSGMYTVYFY